MAAKKLGKIFVELGLDSTEFTNGEAKILQQAQSTSLQMEKNWRTLGSHSDTIFNAMKNNITNAYDAIVRNTKSSHAEIIRAEEMKNAKLAALNEQQFGKQTSLMSNLKSHWLAATAVMAVAAGTIVKVWDMAKAGAEYDEQRGMLDNLTTKYKTTADTIVDEMDRASKFQIAKSELMQIALAGIAKGLNPEQLINLANAAETLGDAVGKDATTALRELTEALETGRTKGLKNYLGTALDLETVFGDLTSKMTAAEKSQAMYNMTMIAATEIQNKQTKKIDEARDSIAQVEKKFADATLAASRFFKTVVVGLLDMPKKIADAYASPSIDLLTGLPIPGEVQGFDYGMPASAEIASTAPYEKEIKRIKEVIANRQDLKKVTKEAAEERKDLIREVEKLSLEAQKTIEAGDTNQWKNMEKLIAARLSEEEKAAEERMKVYREIGADEEKAMMATTKTYKANLEEQTEFAKQAARNMQDAFADFFFSALSGDLKTFGDYWDSFWNSMKKTLANTFAEMALSWAGSQIKQILTGSGTGSIIGSILPAIASVAEGAWAAASTWASSLFFHEGGIVGKEGQYGLGNLASDEVVAILKRGEMVLTKEQARLFFGGAGQGISGEGVIGPEGGQMSLGGMIGLLGIAALGLPGIAAAAAAALSGSIPGIIATGLNISKGWGIVSESMSATADAEAAVAAVAAAGGWGDIGAGDGGGFGGVVGGGGDSMGYATGGIVPYDQRARVHRGEGVFTPEQMKALSPGGDQPITITVPVYIDSREVSRTVYDGIYDASRRGQVKLHQRGVKGYTETAGLNI